MSKETLLPKVFLLLHNAIVAKHAKLCEAKGVEVPSTTTALYGHGQDVDEENSIMAMMLETASIKNYIEKNGKKKNINGKALYDRRLDAEKDNAIKLPKLYAAIYPLFLEYDNLEAFLQANTTAGAVVYYTGYYFSKQSEAVKCFGCTIEQRGAEYIIAIKGFHDDLLPDPFEGKGIVKERNFFANLMNEEGVGMTMIIPVENDDFARRQSYLQGALTTMTSKFFPISVRVFLAKGEPADIDEEDDLRIRQYISLQRQVLRATPATIETLDDLMVRGERVSDITNMIGSYWIWRYSNGNILQIKMVIHNDFTVSLEHPMYPNLIGSFSTSKVFNHCLCITCFTKGLQNHEQVISFYMIEKLPHWQVSGILNGAFCNVGTTGAYQQPLVGDNMILYKEKPDAPFELLVPSVIPEGAFAEYVESYDYPELLIVRSKLKVVRERIKGGNA